MKTNFGQALSMHSLEKKGASAWVPFTFLAIGLPFGMWSVFALQGAGTSRSVPFEMETGWFVLLAMVFLGVHGLRGIAWSSVSVLLTIEALAYFVAIPLWRFATGVDEVDSGYTHAMWLVLIGFIAFWVASLATMRRVEMRFSPRFLDTRPRVTLISVAMCGIGLALKLVMWRAGLYSYAADTQSVAGFETSIQWMGYLADLLSAALVISAIEVLGKRSREPLIRGVFAVSLLSSVGFGLISGMKGEIVQPFLFVALVYGISRGRLPRSAVLLPMVLVVLIYPFVSAYRYNLKKGYGAQVNTVEGLEATLEQSFSDAFLTVGSISAGTAQSNSEEAQRRLSYLTDVRDIIQLPAPSLLAGDEKIWLAPVYPFVPRALWKDKPVLDKGVRFAIALGSGGGTSAAMTPIGDLYSMYGTYGVVIGMFIYGLGLQQYTNWRGGYLSEKGLFIHASILMTFLQFEGDITGTIAGGIQIFVFVLVTAYIVYGRSSFYLNRDSVRQIEHI